MIVGLEPVIVLFKITYTACCKKWRGMFKTVLFEIINFAPHIYNTVRKVSIHKQKV